MPRGHENNLKKKAENPKSGRKLSSRKPDSVDALRDSGGGSLKNPFEDIPKNLVFNKDRCEEFSVVHIQNPDQE